MKKIFILILLFFINCNSKSEFDLEETLKIERRDLIIMEIDTYINKKSEYGEQIEKLNLSQRAFLYIENLEREINNGGFNQFYTNSSGNFSQETIDALLKIGAEKTAKIVKKANSEFENGNVPKNKIERQKKLKFIEKKANKNWNKYNSEFYNYQDNLTELLITFVLKNKTDFKN